MPGFDRTGPMGMGPMTGGARGWCNPYTSYGGPYYPMGFGRGFGMGRGRCRGHRHWYWATGMPGWMRFEPMGPWGYPGFYPAPSYTREQEISFLRDQASALKGELEAIESRLKELESEAQASQ